MEAETEKKGKEFGFWGRRERGREREREEEEVGPKPELSLKKSEQKAEHTKQASKAKE